MLSYRHRRGGYSRHHQPNVGVLQFVGGKCLFDGLRELLKRVGNLQFNGFGGIEESLQVLALAEHLAAVLPQALKHAVAV